MGESTPWPTRHQDQRVAAWALKILRRQIPEPSAEQRLWMAVIEKAVREAYGGGLDAGEPREDAQAWLASEAFGEVATLAGLHPRWAQQVIGTLGGLAGPDAGDGTLPSPRAPFLIRATPDESGSGLD